MNRTPTSHDDMPTNIRRARTPLGTIAFGLIALILALGWIGRERAFARTLAEPVKSGTVNVVDVTMGPHKYQDKVVGQAGIYFQGDTSASTSFVTGRFVLEAGKTPHAPHTHVEEEVMVVESGVGTIDVGGKITKVGPGSAMYTGPNVSHGINNTGDTPLVFYFIKWAPGTSR